MTLIEAVTIELGSAIAKSILKIWLKDFPVGVDASSSLIDLLKMRTPDVLAQRRGQRQFEKIGEMVGEDLLPIFELDGAKLEDSSRVAVAVAVADTINNLSSSLLAQRNLDPAELTKYILVTYPPEKLHFEPAESELYKRIIQVSCPYITDIASQLPSFNERTFAEVLKRESLLIEKAEQILLEVRRIREWLGPTESGRFEEDYCKAVARKLDELELFGTNMPKESPSRRHRLSVAYITLSVEQRTQSLSHDKLLSSIATKQYIRDSKDAQDIPETVIVSVDSALADSRYLLLSGAAGSGKTTLLQWVAVKSALKSFEEPLSSWNDTVPFYIRLRSFMPTSLPKPEEFPTLVAPAIAGTMPKGWVHTQLQSGRAIVLIDGLDEVATQHREKVRDWLDDLLEAFPRSRYIITSRPHAVEKVWRNATKFSRAELQEMELSDIYSFIEHWHQAVREELRDEDEKAELVPLSEHLKDDMKHNKAIQRLATNPLLCAMFCALNRDRRQQLPADRIELYEACCSLLLERRDKERLVDLSEYPALNYRQKRLLLEDMAYWMIKNNYSEADMKLVDERFDRKLKDMPGVAQNTSGADVRRLFVERSGIIREPATGRIDFTHRTFEEFLAAHAASDEIDTGLLVEKAHNDQWREVIILASGLAAKQMREELIKGLVTRGDAEIVHRYQLHLLAVACLETSIQLGKEVRLEVEQRLSELVPPKSMTEARDLVPAGELVVKYLGKSHLGNQKLSASTIAACIRTLALIGGDDALKEIEGYTTDTRATVVSEILESWNYFNREIYAKQVLAPMIGNTTTLNLAHLPSLDGFQYFTSLTSLTLTDCLQITDLTLLSNLTKLNSLILANLWHTTNLAPLSSLTKLVSLDLSGCEQIDDLTPLSNLTRLASLDLSGCKQIIDLTPISSLVNLTSLTLTSCLQITDLSPLAGLTNLSMLNLADCPLITDLAPLASLVNLTSLTLTNCLQIADLAPLAGLTNLSMLNLAGCSFITELSAIANLKKLKTLILDESQTNVNIPNSIKGQFRIHWTD